MMDIKAAPIQIFIDTQVLRSLSFNWQHPDLLSLKRRIEKGSIHVLTSDIVIKECERQLYGMLNEYRQAIEKAQSKAQFLNLSLPSITSQLEGLAKNLPDSELVKNGAREFFRSISATIVHYPKSIERLFGLYFEGRAPFGVRGKNSEFPDAANVLSLLDHGSLSSKPILVVSGDEDWRRVAEQFGNIEYVPTLGEALGMGIRLEWTDAELWSDEELLMHISNKIDDLKSALHLSLTMDSRVNLGDGELQYLQIFSVSPTYFVATDIQKKGSVIHCRGELSYDVSFHAEISLGDAAMNDDLEQDIDGSDVLTATLEFEFDAGAPENITNIQASHLDGLELELDMSITS